MTDQNRDQKSGDQAGQRDQGQNKPGSTGGAQKPNIPERGHEGVSGDDRNPGGTTGSGSGEQGDRDVKR